MPAWEKARLAWGAALLLIPGPLSRALDGEPVEGVEALLARLLGARALAQTLLLRAGHRRRTALAAAAVDGAHATSMVVLAARRRAHSRSAALGAAVAAMWALDELSLAGCRA